MDAAQHNYDFLTKLRSKFSNQEIAELTGYGIDSVQAWVSPTDSKRWRAVPDRAVALATLKLKERGINIDE